MNTADHTAETPGKGSSGAASQPALSQRYDPAGTGGVGKGSRASGGLRILPGRPAASPEGDPCLPGPVCFRDEKGPGAARNLASCLWGKGRLSGAVPAPVFRGASGASKRAGRQLCDPKPSGGGASFAGAGSHGAGRRGYAGGSGEHEKLEIVQAAEVGSGRNRSPAHTLFNSR